MLRTADPQLIIVMSISIIIIAPITEEYMFRHTIYRAVRLFYINMSCNIRRRLGTKFMPFQLMTPNKLKPSHLFSSVVVSILFALIHLNLAAIPALFFLAMVLQECYRRTKSIYMCIAIHAIFNMTTVVAIIALRAQGYS